MFISTQNFQILLSLIKLELPLLPGTFGRGRPWAFFGFSGVFMAFGGLGAFHIGITGRVMEYWSMNEYKWRIEVREQREEEREC